MLRRFIHDFFIPHAGNDHRPHVLRHHVLAGSGLFLVLLKIVVVVISIALPSAFVHSSAITPENIIELTNKTRHGFGLSPLKANLLLSNAANAKAEDMLKHQYFAHKSPTGVTPWDFIRGAGYHYLYSAENLAVHYSSAEDVEGGWLVSPTHRANIINPRYEEIGVGIAFGAFEGTSTTIVVQMFGTSDMPRILCPTPACLMLSR